MTRFFVCCVVLNFLTGCSSDSDGPARYELKGQVTYNGQPVPFGELIFSPDAAAGNSGPGAVAQIVEGKYQIAREQGVVGGPYVVTVSGFSAAPSQAAVPEPGTAAPQPLFPPLELKKNLPAADGTLDLVLPAK